MTEETTAPGRARTMAVGRAGRQARGRLEAAPDAAPVRDQVRDEVCVRLPADGAYLSVLQNSGVANNSCSQGGAGVYSGILVNCTVTSHSPPSFSWAVYDSVARNCIIYDNYTGLGQLNWGPSSSSSKLSYCCTTGLNGNGNITNWPQLFSGFYLTTTSPCRSACTTPSTTRATSSSARSRSPISASAIARFASSSTTTSTSATPTSASYGPARSWRPAPSCRA